MSYEMPGAYGPEELTCRYGDSKLLFRGPKRSLADPYVACIGGTETFGKFVPDPFPSILQRRLRQNCVNLGSNNCGLDAILSDQTMLRIADQASVCVLQLLPPQNLSNRFFKVHPRRNDRFVEASAKLIALYPEVDFTEIHFTGHLMRRLREISAERFHDVCYELEQAWLGRMRMLLQRMKTGTLLLWLDMPAQEGERDPVWEIITHSLVDGLSDVAQGILRVPVAQARYSDELDDMVFGTMQQPAAERMLGPATHRIIADRLVSALRDMA